MKYSTSSSRWIVLITLLMIAAVQLPATSARAASISADVAPVASLLPSGAEALLWPRPGSGTVLTAVAVPAGSQDELREMAGLSHYLEHLLFDGFDDLDERGVTEAFEKRSAYINAFTREQTTVFFALAPLEEAVATAELLVGMLTRSKIVPETYAKEKKVILEELAKDHASASGLEGELLRRLLWQGSPLEHPVGGSVESVTATTRDEVVKYWKGRYGASGWRILITGDQTAEELEDVLAVFEPLQASAALPLRNDQLTWPGWGRWAAAEKPAAPKSAGMGGMPAGMGMGHGMPGGGAGTGGSLAMVVAVPDELLASAAELEVLARWLGDPAGPLARALVPDHASEVTVARQPRQPRDLMEIRVEANAGTAPEDLIAQVLGALANAAGGPDEASLNRIVESWASERALTGQRLHYAAVLYGEDLASARGPLAEAFEPVVPAGPQIARAASALLGDCASRSRAAWIADGADELKAPLPDPMSAGDPVQASALGDGPFGSRLATLDNGMVVGVLPELGSPVFGIHLLVADRSLSEPASAPGIADLMHRLLPAGTGLSGSRELARRLSRLGVELKAADSPMIPFDDRYHVADFSYVRLEGPASSLEASLALLAEMIVRPQWDEAGWQKAIASHRAARKEDNRGGAKAGEVLRGFLLGPEHPLARPVSGRTGTELPGEAQVREAWGSWPEGYFAPRKLVLTVSSPAPTERTLEIIEDLFAGGAAGPPVRGTYPEPVTTDGGADKASPESPQITVQWGRLADVPPKDAAALLMAVDALSDQMVAVIREREGMAYRLGAGVRAVPGGTWILAASVGTRPENRDKVVALLRELVTGLAASPLAEEDLERLGARSRRSTMLRSLAAASRAYRLGRALFEGPSSPLLVDSAALEAVTPAQVQSAARRYLDPDAMVLVVTD